MGYVGASAIMHSSVPCQPPAKPFLRYVKGAGDLGLPDIRHPSLKRTEGFVDVFWGPNYLLVVNRAKGNIIPIT